VQYFWSRDSVVGRATGYGLDDRGVGVRVPIRARIFSSPRRQDRWTPTSFLMGTRGSFSGGKAAGAWSWIFTSIKCRDQENVNLCIHSPIRLHGVVLNTFYYLMGNILVIKLTSVVMLSSLKITMLTLFLNILLYFVQPLSYKANEVEAGNKNEGSLNLFEWQASTSHCWLRCELRRYSCPCVQSITHQAMKTYGVVEI
jgi:hypothetical protein